VREDGAWRPTEDSRMSQRKDKDDLSKKKDTDAAEGSRASERIRITFQKKGYGTFGSIYL
jgi:hypothetical protein